MSRDTPLDGDPEGFESFCLALVDQASQPAAEAPPDQDAELFCANFLTLPPEAQEAEAGTLMQEAPSNESPQNTDQRQLPPRVVSHRKAQQRFRAKQKAKQVAETSELIFLRQRVQELEKLASSLPSRTSLPVQGQIIAPYVCCLGHTVGSHADRSRHQQACL